MDRIYVSVTADLLHPGHISFFERAKFFGSILVVGVCSDEEVSSYKRAPILNLAERSLMVSACRIVDEVISPAPAITTKVLIEKFAIDLVVATASYSEKTLEQYYLLISQYVVIFSVILSKTLPQSSQELRK